MKADIELLKADVRDELMKIGKLYAEFAGMEERLDLSNDEIGTYDKAVIGYLLHNFYGGCETIFRSIARFFENEFSSGSWHRDLLKRMKLEVAGFRPRVISDELFLLLDDLRGFRHRFRYSYSFELDWERERIVARRFEKTWGLFQREIESFLEKLDLLMEG